MAATLVIATALTALNPTLIDIESEERIEVAYDALAQGENEAAIARLEAMGAAQSRDPAMLINLGTAYARVGRLTDARAMYARARDAREHYDLELADGEWVDSRRAALLALANLDNRPAMASR